jgi:hypothetical protein
LGRCAEEHPSQEDYFVSQAVHVRNLREGEADTLPPALLNHGMPYLVPEWAWAVEPVSPLGPFGPPARPFALIVASFSHGWLVLWRILAVSPLPSGIPLNWIMEALPRVFTDARPRGCVGFMTMLADNKPAEVKMARIIASLPGATLLPFQGSLGIGSLSEARKEESR